MEATLAGNYKMWTALCNILSEWNKGAHNLVLFPKNQNPNCLFVAVTCTPSAHKYVWSGVEHTVEHSARQCQAPPKPTAASLCMDKWVRLRKTLFSALSLHILPYVLIPVYIMRCMPLRAHRMCTAAKLILLLEPQPLHFLTSCCLVQILLIFFF